MEQRLQSWRDRVLEWEMGLPSAEDLTPLSQTLIPPELASAFSISTDPFRDVRRSSNHTVPDAAEENQEDQELDDADGAANINGRKKRARVVWTPQLHRRFVEVVDHLGIKNAVPKTIVQMMNVEGLTRENVASHLQKFRLYVKRMQADDGGGPSSSSDALFSSTPMPLLPHQRQSMHPVFGSMYQGNGGFQSSGGGNMFG